MPGTLSGHQGLLLRRPLRENPMWSVRCNPCEGHPPKEPISGDYVNRKQVEMASRPAQQCRRPLPDGCNSECVLFCYYRTPSPSSETLLSLVLVSLLAITVPGSWFSYTPSHTPTSPRPSHYSPTLLPPTIANAIIQRLSLVWVNARIVSTLDPHVLTINSPVHQSPQDEGFYSVAQGLR